MNWRYKLKKLLIDFESGKIDIDEIESFTATLINRNESEANEVISKSDLEPLVIKENAEDLLPCPFCGGDAKYNKGMWNIVTCNKCNASVSDGSRSCIENWNKRV